MPMQKNQAELVTKRLLKAMQCIIDEKIEGVTSKVEFATQVGEYKQNIRKMEIGTRYPTIDVLCNACLIFGIDPGWLLLGRGSMFPKGQEHGDLLRRLNELEKRVAKPNVEKKIVKKKVA